MILICSNSTLLHPCLSLSHSASSPSLKPSSLGFGIGIKPNLRKRQQLQRCTAVFPDDAPFAAAIGACMLTSLLFPVPEEDQGDSAVNSTDARFAVMGIVSFIPYFNWLSWVFAWLDTGKRRYAVYAIVYLAPYLRSNLSISPEDSWLPIASILFCIVHIQLEASIRNGDIQGFQLFRKKSHSNHFNEGSMKENKNLPAGDDQSRDVGGWEDSQSPLRSHQALSEELDDEGEDRNRH